MSQPGRPGSLLHASVPRREPALRPFPGAGGAGASGPGEGSPAPNRRGLNPDTHSACDGEELKGPTVFTLCKDVSQGYPEPHTEVWPVGREGQCGLCPSGKGS